MSLILKIEAILMNRRFRRNVLKFAMIVVLSVFMFQLVMTTIEAFDLVNFPDAWKDQSGYGRFLNPNLHFDLDIQKLSWNDPIEKAFYGLASFFFLIYKNLMRLFVLAYYHAITFDLLTSLKPAVIEIMSTLDRIFFKDLNGFLVGFLLLAIVLYYAKQNLQKMWQAFLTYFILMTLSLTIVSNASWLIDDITGMVTSINSGITASIVAGDGEAVGDPYLTSSGGFYYTLFVQPYQEINGEGKLSLSQIEELIKLPSGSEARKNLIAEYNEEYGVFSRSIDNSLNKSVSFILLSVVASLEAVVLLFFAILQIVRQLYLDLQFVLLPIVLALACLPFLGLRILKRYGMNALQTMLYMMMISLLLGFTSKIDMAIASMGGYWLIKLLIRGVIYWLLMTKHDEILSMLTRVIGIYSRGVDAEIESIGRGAGDLAQRGAELLGAGAGLAGAGIVLGSNILYDDVMNRQNLRDLDNVNLGSGGDGDVASGKQMKYARDLEREQGVVNKDDLAKMSKSEISDYINDLKETGQDKGTKKPTPNNNTNPNEHDDGLTDIDTGDEPIASFNSPNMNDSDDGSTHQKDKSNQTHETSTNDNHNEDSPSVGGLNDDVSSEDNLFVEGLTIEEDEDLVSAGDFIDDIHDISYPEEIQLGANYEQVSAEEVETEGVRSDEAETESFGDSMSASDALGAEELTEPDDFRSNEGETEDEEFSFDSIEKGDNLENAEEVKKPKARQNRYEKRHQEILAEARSQNIDLGDINLDDVSHEDRDTLERELRDGWAGGVIKDLRETQNNETTIFDDDYNDVMNQFDD